MAAFDKKAFRDDLRSLASEARLELVPAVRRVSRLVAGTIRRNAPVLTGGTRASVKVGKLSVGRKGISQSVSVGAKRKDAAPVASIEFGDRDEAPNPFIRRSVSQCENEIDRIMTTGGSESP